VRKVGLAVVGCGWGSSDLYGPFFRYLENGAVVAAMDIDRERAERWAERAGAPKVCTELDAVISDPAVEGVLILTPPHLHAEQAERIARSGKHVYCEKPMARTIGEAARIVNACRDHAVLLQVAFMKRFNRSFQRAKQLIEDGAIGEPFEMRAT